MIRNDASCYLLTCNLLTSHRLISRPIATATEVLELPRELLGEHQSQAPTIIAQEIVPMTALRTIDSTTKPLRRHGEVAAIGRLRCVPGMATLKGPT